MHTLLSLYSVSSIALPCGRNITGFFVFMGPFIPHTARMTPTCIFAVDSTVFTADVIPAFFIAQNAAGVWKYYLERRKQNEKTNPCTLPTEGKLSRGVEEASFEKGGAKAG